MGHHAALRTSWTGPRRDGAREVGLAAVRGPSARAVGLSKTELGPRDTGHIFVAADAPTAVTESRILEEPTLETKGTLGKRVGILTFSHMGIRSRLLTKSPLALQTYAFFFSKRGLAWRPRDIVFGPYPAEVRAGAHCTRAQTADVTASPRVHRARSRVTVSAARVQERAGVRRRRSACAGGKRKISALNSHNPRRFSPRTGMANDL